MDNKWIMDNNKAIPRFVDLDEMCSFCGDAPETTLHLFYVCPLSSVFWGDMEKLILDKTGQTFKLAFRDQNLNNND